MPLPTPLEVETGGAQPQPPTYLHHQPNLHRATILDRARMMLKSAAPSDDDDFLLSQYE